MSTSELVLLLVLMGATALMVVVLVVVGIGTEQRRARKDRLDSQPPPADHPRAPGWQPPRRRFWVVDGWIAPVLFLSPVPITLARARHLVGRLRRLQLVVLAAAAVTVMTVLIVDVVT